MKQEEYLEIAGAVIYFYIKRYNFRITPLEYGLQMKNSEVVISIGYRYQEFEMVIQNDTTKTNLMKLILLKYPEYITSDFNIYDPDRLTKNERENFAYILKKSFEFILENFSQIFEGNLSLN